MKRRSLTLLLALAMLTTACSAPDLGDRQARETAPEPVVLQAITLGTEPVGGLQALYGQLDALTIPELGCVLRFTYIPWGDERNQINLALASGEYDFVPQGNFSDYQLMASRNAFLDIKPYLALVPALVEHYQLAGGQTLPETEVGGKLYGIPQYAAPSVGANEGFFYREDLLAQWGLEPVSSLETMEAYLYRAKEDPAFRDNALITDNRVWNGIWMTLSKDLYFEVTGFTDTPYAVCSIDDPYRIISRVETPEFRAMLGYLQRWYRDGILDRRLLTLSTNEGTSGLMLFLDNRKPCETNSPLWSLNRDWLPYLTEKHPEWTYGFFPYESGGRVLGYMASAAHSSLISISSRTQYPELAVRLLEKLHTDQRYFDLLLYGAEGVNYHMEDGVVNFAEIPTNGRFVGWSAGADTYMERQTLYCHNDAWANGVYLPHVELYEDMSAKAQLHPLNGFHFSVGPVSDQAQALEKTWNTYMMPLLCGLSEDIDAELAVALEQLKAAGLDEYLAEMQRQLTDFAQKQPTKE